MSNGEVHQHKQPPTVANQQAFSVGLGPLYGIFFLDDANN